MTHSMDPAPYPTKKVADADCTAFTIVGQTRRRGAHCGHRWCCFPVQPPIANVEGSRYVVKGRNHPCKVLPPVVFIERLPVARDVPRGVLTSA